MKSGWIVLVGGALALSACVSPEDTLQVREAQSFVYVDESFDLFPNRREQGEAWRLQALGRALNAADLCPSGYEIEARTDSETEGRFAGGLYRVSYQGRC